MILYRFIFLSQLMTFSLFSCAWSSQPTAYVPPPQITPNFEKSKDAFYTLNLGMDDLSSFINIYGATAITDKYLASLHIALQNQDNCPTCRKQIYNIAEIGFGTYYSDYNISILGGLGKGNVKHSYDVACKSLFCYPNKDDIVVAKGKFMRYFIGGSYWLSGSANSEEYEKAVSLRFTMLKFTDFEKYNFNNVILFDSKSHTNLLVEPGILLRKSFNHVFIGLQFGFAVPIIVEEEFGYYIFNTSIELGWRNRE